MTKTTYYWLGFISACALFLTPLLCAHPGNTERGSGRRDFTQFLLAEAQGQQKPDRDPDRGNGRRD